MAVRRDWLVGCLVLVCLCLGEMDKVGAQRRQQGPGNAPPPTVRLPQGTIAGREVFLNRAQRVIQYLGVPYAQPPVNQLRFAAPVTDPLPTWSGVRNASNFGASCPQATGRRKLQERLYLRLLPNDQPDPGRSEDCLFLNIYIPDVKVLIKNWVTQLSLLFNFQLFKHVGTFFAIYPMDENASKFAKLTDQFVWYFLFVNETLVALAIFRSLCYAVLDLSTFITSSFELIVCFNVLLTLLYTKTQKPQIKDLSIILEDFILNANDEKKKLIRKHGSCYFRLYAASFGTVAILTSSFVYKSLSSVPKELPLWTDYPFSINSSTTWTLLYIHQLFATFSPVTIFYLDSLISMFFFLAIVELKQLKREFKNANNYDNLTSCIFKHQFIIQYLQKMNSLARLYILKSIIILSMYVIMNSLNFFTSEISPAIMVVQIFSIIIAVMRFYIFSLCTENLKQSGYDIGLAVYSSQWHQQSREIVLAKSMVILRSQKPLDVSIPGVLKSWDMRYLSNVSVTSCGRVPIVSFVTWIVRYSKLCL